MKGKLLQAGSGLTRRNFLTFSGWLALTATTVGTPLAAQAAKFDKDLYHVTGGRLAMATFVNITVFHPSKDQAQEAIDKSFTEMNRLIGILSGHDSSTPVSYLNHTGSLRDVPPELADVVGSSFHIHDHTEGAFDVTVKPLLDLYEKFFQTQDEPPPRAEIVGMLPEVGIKHLRMANNQISFENDRMGVTLDGLAKGYIVDRMMQVLQKNGVKHALINAGGDIRVCGSKGDGKPWNIGIQDPWDKKKVVDTVQLSHGAIATSGNYVVYYDRNRLYHHIVSPRYGTPAQGLASVTIIAPSTMVADALSTGVFVMGADQGRAFIKKKAGVAGMLIDSQKMRHYSDWPHKA